MITRLTIPVATLLMSGDLLTLATVKVATFVERVGTEPPPAFLSAAVFQSVLVLPQLMATACAAAAAATQSAKKNSDIQIWWMPERDGWRIARLPFNK